MSKSEFLSAEQKARLLKRWEACVATEPEVARQFGPPNWLVIERARRGEDHEVAAARIKAGYGLTGATMQPRATVSRAVATEAQPEEVVAEKRVCEVCGKSILSRKICGTCRSKRSRAKRGANR